MLELVESSELACWGCDNAVWQAQEACADQSQIPHSNLADKPKSPSFTFILDHSKGPASLPRVAAQEASFRTRAGWLTVKVADRRANGVPNAGARRASGVQNAGVAPGWAGGQV